jgi:Domain of unknown function (DUF4349)
MIAEDLLERGLADLAGGYDVPVDAPDRIRDQLLPSVADDDLAAGWRGRLHSPTPRGWMMLAAAAIVVIIVASFAVGGGSSNRTTLSESAGAPGVSNDRGEASGGGTAVDAVPAPSAVAGAARAPKAVHTQVSGSTAAGFAPVNGAGSITTGSGTTAGTSNGPLPPVPAVPDKVIKTGELDLQVKKGEVSHTLDQLTGLATIERGYVADSRTSEGGSAPSGEVTLRVPVVAFDDTVKRARTMVGVKVLNLQTSGRDVTSKFVDLRARISALKKTRETFLTLLAKANTIGETLAVQQHVTDVQTQIEQLQGQKKVLVNQAALSTLTVTVDQKVVVETAPTHHKSGLHRAVDRSVSRFVHGIEAIIGIIGPLLLAALIVGLGWLAARFGYRRLRRRMV